MRLWSAFSFNNLMAQLLAFGPIVYVVLNRSCRGRLSSPATPMAKDYPGSQGQRKQPCHE